jgi:hypothetical protein
MQGERTGDGLGALGDGVLGELSGQDESDRGLDLSRGDGRLFVVRGELGGLGCDALYKGGTEQVSTTLLFARQGRRERERKRERETDLEDVVDKRVEDRHGLVRDTSVGVDLLEDLVDVGRVRLLGGRLFSGSLGGG